MLRGVLANIPTLGDGEFYLAVDTGQLFVGFSGGNLQVSQMAIQIQDPTTGTQVAAVQPKGTQGTYLLCVQDAKDSGRSKVILTLTKAAAITSEALVTMTIKKGDAAPTTGTSYTVTSGKTFRIQSVFLGVTSNSAALVNAAIRVREGAASGGAVAVGSDIIAELEAATSAATSGLGAQASVDFPDGMEITGGQQIGISELASATTAVVTVVIVGFEY
jgi:hypothetical protein